MNREQRRTILGTFIVAYVLYVATETTAAGWIAPHLHRIGYSSSIGSIITAGFWLGLALGRRPRRTGRPATLGPPRRPRRARHCRRALRAGARERCRAVRISPRGPLNCAGLPMAFIWYATLCPHDDDGVALLIFA